VHRAVYFISWGVLVIADLHLGKAQHFRKHGIAVPVSVTETNYAKLQELIYLYDPVEIIFLGDLFHSKKNTSFNQFAEFRRRFPKIQFSLTIGNHDIYAIEEYQKIGMICRREIIKDDIIFIHDEEHLHKNESEYYSISGHIHPAIRLKLGIDKKSIPAFFIGAKRALLPSYGGFTGFHCIKPKSSDKVYGLVEDSIMKI